MTEQRSRRLGKALMALAVFQVLAFLHGAVRRSYAAVALPVALGVAAVSGLAFWIGYTMAAREWDDGAFGDADPEGQATAAQP